MVTANVPESKLMNRCFLSARSDLFKVNTADNVYCIGHNKDVPRVDCMYVCVRVCVCVCVCVCVHVLKWL